jgi:uncharacterized protein involved in cysteine biosynthesis
VLLPLLLLIELLDILQVYFQQGGETVKEWMSGMWGWR